MQYALPFGIESPLQSVRGCLLAVHGPQRDAQRHDPGQQLLKAILSSRTYDADSETVFQRVMQLSPSPEALTHMSRTVLTKAIGSVTFADDKAVYLVEAAQYICTRRGQFDLAFLDEWPVDDALFWLQQMRGIGPKVAAVILNFSSLRKRTFAIDTHVLRVFKRLGLVHSKATFKQAHKGLMRLVPDDWDADDLYELHWLMKMHGQTRCRHYEPLCRGCPLAKLCSTYSAAVVVKTKSVRPGLATT